MPRDGVAAIGADAACMSPVSYARAPVTIHYDMEQTRVSSSERFLNFWHCVTGKALAAVRGLEVNIDSFRDDTLATRR